MNRRELLVLLGGAMTAARAPRAQQKAMPVIGFLSSRTPGDAAGVVAAFRQGLAEKADIFNRLFGVIRGAMFAVAKPVAH